jgi:hypothetical protein
LVIPLLNYENDEVKLFAGQILLNTAHENSAITVLEELEKKSGFVAFTAKYNLIEHPGEADSY